MNKNFKITAIVIIAIGALLFIREKRLANAEKEMYQKYSDDRASNAKQSADKFEASAAAIKQNDSNINKCLAKVKPVSMQTVQEEAGILMALLKTIDNAKKDSLEKVNSGDKSVLAKLNKKNTIVVYFNKLGNNKLALTSNVRQLITDDYSYSSNLSTATDLETMKKDETLERAAAVKYIVVVQPEKIKNGKLLKSEQFEPGYLILDYDVYDITSGEKLKASSLFATNSESLYLMSSTDAGMMIYNDLVRQGNKAVSKTIFGNLDQQHNL